MRNQQAGVTLPELIIVIVIIGILAAIAVPSFSRMLERNRIKEAAVGLNADLHLARSEAVKRSDTVTVTFTTGANWQYVIAAGATTLKTVTATSSAVTLSSATNYSFDSRRGEETNTGVARFDTTNYQLQVESDNNWKLLTCNSTGSKAVGGYESC